MTNYKFDKGNSFSRVVVDRSTVKERDDSLTPNALPTVHVRRPMFLRPGKTVHSWFDNSVALDTRFGTRYRMYNKGGQPIIECYTDDDGLAKCEEFDDQSTNIEDDNGDRHLDSSFAYKLVDGAGSEQRPINRDFVDFERLPEGKTIYFNAVQGDNGTCALKPTEVGHEEELAWALRKIPPWPDDRSGSATRRVSDRGNTSEST